MAIIKIVPMPGIPGPTGASAYQIAVTNGFVGTEQEWLDSLGNQNLDGIVTQTWGYPTESSKAIRPELAGESIALKSSESAAIRWHVRENSPSIVLSPLLPTAAVVTPVGDGNYYVDFTINTQDYAPTTSQHYYEVIAPESTDYQGNFLPVSSNTTSLRLLYEADPGVFDATDAEITQPSVYSQFEVNEDGAYIKIANWTDGPGGYSQSWQFTKDGEIHFPYNYSNGRTGSGDVLRFAQSFDQAIIMGPNPTYANPNANRLVVAGADGTAGDGYDGEGGDVYVWAGQGGGSNGDGGDVKVDAGNGQGTGQGGYVKVRGGYSSNGTGGFVQITGGGSSSGTGGDISLTTYNNGNIVLSGSGGEFLNDATNPGNQIATIAYSREHYTTAATITGAIADMGKLLYANCGDGDMTYLIPDNGDVEFPIGSEIKFATGGDARWFIDRENVEGATDLIADGGNGYTAINDPYPYIIPIYSTGTLLKVDTNRWILSGMRLTD